ncbi:MAG: transglutaminase family protein [Parvularculaceae bacterium]
MSIDATPLPAGGDNRPKVSTDLLQVRHVTSYRYRMPVKFGPHRAMFRPHQTNDLNLTSFEITTTPDSTHRWMHDVFSNSRVVLDFSAAAPSEILTVACLFSVVRTTIHEQSFPILEFARTYPFAYPDEQWTDLQPTAQPEFDDADGMVEDWARSFFDLANGDTWGLLQAMNTGVHQGFHYVRREEPGVRSPRETLRRGEGSCRDFATLMIEGARRLGFAARFVTGYLYDPMADIKESGMKGAGATHAWVQIFLPGAGWIEFDPTNGLIASGNLIRTGVARTHAQAVPLEGSFKGAFEDFLGMDVEVDVTALAPTLYG